MTLSIPLGLKAALESGECVLFLGAGIGEHMKTSLGRCAPTAAELAVELCVQFSIATTSDNLAKVSQVVELRKSRSHLDTFLRQRFSDLDPDSTLRWVASQRWRAIFTTNYDRSIERAYELTASPPQIPVSISATRDLKSIDPRFEVPIYHIHGVLFGEHQEIVITENDYVKFRERRRMLFEILKHSFATTPFLYIGYKNADPNWHLVLNEVAEEFSPSQLPHSYRVARKTDPIDAELLLAKGIETVKGSFADFVVQAGVVLSGAKIAPDKLAKIKATVPTALANAFESNPAATARLVSSWTLVNEAPFQDEPNLQAFLKGDRPNWALVGQGNVFERDIEEDVYDNVLDYVTSAPRGPASIAVLAPAGYGITTLLMSLSAKFVADSVGPIFYLRPGAAVLEGDLEFAASQFDQPAIFVIDDAADHVGGVATVLSLFKSLSRPGLFVLGDRKNEWMQAHPKFSPKRYEIEPLSGAETERLIIYLERNRALNQLEPLSNEMRVNAIQQRLGKELLVVMREATEGKGFDAIIEDEYRGIRDERQRNLYLAVCCLFQHGAMIRDRTLALVIGVDFANFYKEIGDGLEGVVVFECIDDANGIYAARARHRTIAAVVWMRCGEPAFREELIRKSLDALNLNFASDVSAFEHLVRSDHLIDCIRTLDGKISFFDKACNKDPSSPYVRQHYARMLSREGKHDLALGQIEAGIDLNPRAAPRVLYHTKGLILTDLTKSISSTEIARKRLVQAEEMFRKAINLNPKDAYGYHGLAVLFLEWAKRSSDEEGADYVSRAEGVIGEGLRKSRDKDSLWIVSSDIYDWVGNQPSRLRALEQGVKATPGTIIGRYLLAREYRRGFRFKDALAVLEPVIKHHHEEFRAHLEYAYAMLGAGDLKRNAIAILKQSTLYGLNDPRYIATLGGLLFLDGDFGEAEKTFQDALKRDFSSVELNKSYFRPQLGATEEPLKMRGSVVVVRRGFALIEAEGFPKFLSPASKAGGFVYRVGAKVEFVVEFSAKAALAVSLTSLS